MFREAPNQVLGLLKQEPPGGDPSHEVAFAQGGERSAYPPGVAGVGYLVAPAVEANVPEVLVKGETGE